MSKRKAYDVSLKLKAVECAEKKGKEAAAREMGVDSKMIREWCKQKQMLANLKKKGVSSCKRQCGAGLESICMAETKDVLCASHMLSFVLEIMLCIQINCHVI